MQPNCFPISQLYCVQQPEWKTLLQLHWTTKSSSCCCNFPPFLIKPDFADYNVTVAIALYIQITITVLLLHDLLLVTWSNINAPTLSVILCTSKYLRYIRLSRKFCMGSVLYIVLCINRILDLSKTKKTETKFLAPVLAIFSPPWFIKAIHTIYL